MEHLIALYHSDHVDVPLMAGLLDSLRATVRLFAPPAQAPGRTFSATLSAGFDLRQTTLLGTLEQLFNPVPQDLLALPIDYPLPYGYIGSDGSPYMIEPGAVVWLDTRRTKIGSGWLRGQVECPLFFVELRSGYACGWCEVRDGKVLLHSGPLLSDVRRVMAFRDIDVIGQVRNVMLKLQIEHVKMK
jgi:hypothetical protein